MFKRIKDSFKRKLEGVRNRAIEELTIYAMERNIVAEGLLVDILSSDRFSGAREKAINYILTGIKYDDPAAKRLLEEVIRRPGPHQRRLIGDIIDHSLKGYRGAIDTLNGLFLAQDKYGIHHLIREILNEEHVRKMVDVMTELSKNGPLYADTVARVLRNILQDNRYSHLHRPILEQLRYHIAKGDPTAERFLEKLSEET